MLVLNLFNTSLGTWLIKFYKKNIIIYLFFYFAIVRIITAIHLMVRNNNIT